MFEIGGWELFVIGVVALVVVGPKDLPRLVRNVGRWVGKARALARDFQTGMEKAAREADLEDETKALRDVERGLREGAAGLTRDLRGVSTASSPAVVASTRAAPVSTAVAPAAAARAEPARPDPRADADDALLRDFERGARGDR